MATVSELGEDSLVAKLVAGLPVNAEVRVAAGDDCAAVGNVDESHWTLLKTDCVIEGVHFLADASPESVGWKALARALSDVAAMGGSPQQALVTIALPSDFEVERAAGIYRGLRQAAEQFHVAIVGG